MDSSLVGRGALSLRGLAVDPPLFNAPMAGLSHSAMRRLFLHFGGVGCFFTEMLAAKRLPSENPNRSALVKRTDAESPLAYQLLAATPDELLPAIKVAAGVGAEVIDINFGCPAPPIRRMGGGSKLMESAEAAALLFSSARAATDLPLTAKVRLGETLDEAYLRDFVLMLEGCGADLITVHGRLRGEGYGRPPRWDWIGKVKSWVEIPVVGNGSIFSVDDGRRALEISGCDGLMVGRGAITRPWLFSELANGLYGKELSVKTPNLPDIYSKFAALLVESFKEHQRLIRLKAFTQYFSKNFPFGHNMAMRVGGAKSWDDAMLRAEEFFKSADPDFKGWGSMEKSEG